MPELLEIYDKHKRKTGMLVDRTKKKKMKKGQYVLATSILIQNDKNEILLQKVAKAKGNYFALPSGHVDIGETSKSAIIREVKEEQGIILEEQEVSLLDEKMADSWTFYDVYYSRKNVDIKDMVLNKKEVESVKWFSELELMEEFKKGSIRESSEKTITKFLENAR